MYFVILLLTAVKGEKLDCFVFIHFLMNEKTLIKPYLTQRCFSFLKDEVLETAETRAGTRPRCLSSHLFVRVIVVQPRSQGMLSLDI